HSPETKTWSEAQDDLVRPYLDGLPGREHLSQRLRALMPGYVGPPTARGERSFFQRREPDQEHAVLLVREADGENPASERTLIDPTALSPDATTTLDAWHPSKEGNLLAY